MAPQRSLLLTREAVTISLHMAQDTLQVESVKDLEGLPWQYSGWESTLPFREVRVQSLVRELGPTCCVSQPQKNKKQTKKDLEIRKSPWIIQVGAVLSQGLLYKKEPQVRVRERDVAVEAEVGVMWGQELRNEGASRHQKRQGNRFSPWPLERTQLCDLFQIPAYKTVMNLCGLEPLS